LRGHPHGVAFRRSTPEVRAPRHRCACTVLPRARGEAGVQTDHTHKRLVRVSVAGQNAHQDTEPAGRGRVAAP
jgi:hypothetical protein